MPFFSILYRYKKKYFFGENRAVSEEIPGKAS